MSKHTIRVTRDGMTSCPACNQFFKVDVEALAEVTCPFCQANLVESTRAGNGGMMQTLRSSRSGLVAAMLGASLLTACPGEEDDDDDPAEEVVDMPEEADMAVEEIDEGQVATPDYGIGPFEE